MRTATILLLSAILAAGCPAEARTRTGVHHPPRAPRVHKPRKPRSAYRQVRIKREDGTVWTGYRDELGTHLRGPDGRMIHCQRNRISAADIDVACR